MGRERTKETTHVVMDESIAICAPGVKVIVNCCAPTVLVTDEWIRTPMYDNDRIYKQTKKRCLVPWKPNSRWKGL